MKSRITIDVDFENHNLPIIKVVQEQSSDVRDALLQQLLNSFDRECRWLRIEYKGNQPISSEGGSPEASYRHYYSIGAIPEKEIEEEIRLMQAYLNRAK